MTDAEPWECEQSTHPQHVWHGSANHAQEFEQRINRTFELIEGSGAAVTDAETELMEICMKARIRGSEKYRQSCRCRPHARPYDRAL